MTDNQAGTTAAGTISTATSSTRCPRSKELRGPSPRQFTPGE